MEYKNTIKHIVKTEFDFGWKTQINPEIAELAFKHAGESILDVGCGTCQLYYYLRKRGWKGKYYGIDIRRYEGFKYPEDIVFILGDALEVEFPKVDTVILYNILEHVDDPIKLLSKAFRAASKNVLINVPKRNEDLWRKGIVEWHQVDRDHRHNGFTVDELQKVVELAGGKIIRLKEHWPITAEIGINLWKSVIPKIIVRLLS